MHQNWWGHGTPSLKSCEAQNPNVEIDKPQLHAPTKCMRKTEVSP